MSKFIQHLKRANYTDMSDSYVKIDMSSDYASRIYMHAIELRDRIIKERVSNFEECIAKHRRKKGDLIKKGKNGWFKKTDPVYQLEDETDEETFKRLKKAIIDNYLEYMGTDDYYAIHPARYQRTLDVAELFIKMYDHKQDLYLTVDKFQHISL